MTPTDARSPLVSATDIAAPVAAVPLGFASLYDPQPAALAGPGTLDGLRGAGPDGGTWDVHGGWVTSYPAQSPVQERG